MGSAIAKIKRDFAKHRAKAVVLGILSVVMAVFVTKAVFEMTPKKAEADSTSSSFAAAQSDQTPASAVEAEEHMKHSRDLWNALRENHGMDGAAAFTFDASFYPLDPKRPMTAEAPEVVQKIQTQTPAVDFAEEQRTHLSLLREQARALLIRSTVVGTGNPVAVINDKILKVGDHILGFEITNIKSREVEFKKDGITLAVKMSDDARGE